MEQRFTRYSDAFDEPARMGVDPPNQSATVFDAEQVIRRAFVQNPKEGYELLFRRFYKPLCSHAVRYVYDRDVAEDIVSDVFLNLWRTRAYQTITDTFDAYLFGAVRNRVFNHLRNQALHESINAALLADNAFVVTDDPHQILQGTELYGRIQEIITRLPPQCQRVFMLSRFEGRSYAQIAEQLHISIKTVETHLSKALAALRQMLANEPLLFRR